MRALRDALDAQEAPVQAEHLARRFTRARRRRVVELLETLTALGHARRTDDGLFAA